MRLTGCCCRATRTPDQQHSSTTKEQLLWGGASLRSPLAFRGAAAVDAAGLHEHRTNNSSTKEHLLWGGASLRSPMRLTGCCCGGSCCCCWATRTPDLLLGYSNTGPFAGLLEQRTFAGLLEQRTFAGLLPLLLRPLPLSPPPSPRLAVNHNTRL